jgi:hypothetical protein
MRKISAIPVATLTAPFIGVIVSVIAAVILVYPVVLAGLWVLAVWLSFLIFSGGSKILFLTVAIGPIAMAIYAVGWVMAYRSFLEGSGSYYRSSGPRFPTGLHPDETDRNP